MDSIDTRDMQTILSKNAFRDCAAGVKGTPEDANYRNGLMFELLNAIEKSGQTPLDFDSANPESYNQIFRAMQFIPLWEASNTFKIVKNASGGIFALIEGGDSTQDTATDQWVQINLGHQKIIQIQGESGVTDNLTNTHADVAVINFTPKRSDSTIEVSYSGAFVRERVGLSGSFTAMLIDVLDNGTHNMGLRQSIASGHFSDTQFNHQGSVSRGLIIPSWGTASRTFNLQVVIFGETTNATINQLTSTFTIKEFI